MIRSIAISSLLSFMIICSSLAGQDRCWEYKTSSMGTSWKVIICDESLVDTVAIARMLESNISEMDSLWSNFRPDSEVALLAMRAGTNEWTRVNPKTLDLLRKSKHMFNESNGIFDVTVGPLSKRWRAAFLKKSYPDQEKLAKEKVLVNSDAMVISDQGEVYLTLAGMQVDLGGIAKGYAVDQLFELLTSMGYHQILIEGGGDLRVGDAPPGENGWKVMIEDIGIYEIDNIALASSGGTYRYLSFHDKKLQHHINPKDGQAIALRPSVTVKAKKCWEADAWSTIAVFDKNLVEKERFITLQSIAKMP